MREKELNYSKQLNIHTLITVAHIPLSQASHANRWQLSVLQWTHRPSDVASHKRLPQDSHIALKCFGVSNTTYIHLSINSLQDELISPSNMDHTSVYRGGKRTKRWKELRDERREGGDKKKGWQAAWGGESWGGTKHDWSEKVSKWHCSFKGRRSALMRQQSDGWTLLTGWARRSGKKRDDLIVTASSKPVSHLHITHNAFLQYD